MLNFFTILKNSRKYIYRRIGFPNMADGDSAPGSGTASGQLADRHGVCGNDDGVGADPGKGRREDDADVSEEGP